MACSAADMSNRDGMKRRVKEALYINEEKHSMKKDKGLELNPIWFSLYFPNTLCNISKSITYLVSQLPTSILGTYSFFSSFPGHSLVP